MNRTKNRIAAFYQTQDMMPYEDALAAEREAFDAGWGDGYCNGLTCWYVIGGLGFIVGFLFACVVS